MKDVWIPIAVFRGEYGRAHFDHSGAWIVAATSSDVRALPATGRGTPKAVPIAKPPLQLAFAVPKSGDQSSVALVVADGAGVRIDTDSIEYFTKNVPSLIASAVSDDGTRAFVMGDRNGAVGTRNAVFEIDAATGTVERLLDLRDDVAALGYSGGKLLCVTRIGHIYAVSKQGVSRVWTQPNLKSNRDLAVEMSSTRVVVWDRARNSVDVWLTTTGEVVRSPYYIRYPTSIVAVAAGDLNHAIAGSDDIALDSALPPAFRRPSGHLSDIALGQSLLAASDDGSVYLWQPVEKSTIAVRLPVASERPVIHVELTTDGKRALALSSDGTITVWEVGKKPTLQGVPADRVAATLRAATSACLTETERATLLGEDAHTAKAGYETCTSAANAPTE